MDRRSFFRFVTGSGIATWSLRVQVLVLAGGHGREALAAGKAYDLIIDGYSIYDGQKLGRAGVLKATQIAAGKAIAALPYQQDDHGHTFDLSEQHLRMLLNNQVVEVETTVMQDHKHKVRIEPQNKADPSAPGVDVPDQPAPSNPPGQTPPGPTPPGSQQPSDLKAVLDQSCTECHHPGSPTPMDLTGTITKEQADKIMARVASKDPKTVMPPGFRTPLDDRQVEALKKLLEAAAKP